MIPRAKCRPPPPGFQAHVQTALCKDFFDVGGELCSALGLIRVNYFTSRGDSTPTAASSQPLLTSFSFLWR